MNIDNLNEQSNIEKECSEPVQETNKKNENKHKGSFFVKKETGKEDKLKDEIEKLKEDKKELHEKFLLLYSDFENYKKRTQKEKIDLIFTASEKVIKDILPVIDDFQRAIVANETVEDINVIKEGFNLIYQKMLQILKKHDIDEIGIIGEPFNTDIHEAIAHVPAQSDGEKNSIIDVTQKGYKIKDKIIRYAKVVVGI